MAPGHIHWLNSVEMGSGPTSALSFKKVEAAQLLTLEGKPRSNSTSHCQSDSDSNLFMATDALVFEGSGFLA